MAGLRLTTRLIVPLAYLLNLPLLLLDKGVQTSQVVLIRVAVLYTLDERGESFKIFRGPGRGIKRELRSIYGRPNGPRGQMSRPREGGGVAQFT